MKVKDLIKVLKELPEDAIVVLSSDEEGNSYSPLASYNTNYMYIPDSDWSGEIKIKELTPELIKHGYTEEEVYGYTEYDDDEPDTNGIPALVLWPTR